MGSWIPFPCVFNNVLEIFREGMLSGIEYLVAEGRIELPTYGL